MTEIFAKPATSAIIEKIINKEKHILIQERFKQNTPSENGLLEIPGGKIREFENVYDCLRREVKEETGLEITKIQGEEDSNIIEYTDYKVLNYNPFACAQNIKGYYPIMTEIFICETKGELLKQSDESVNIRWISVQDLKMLLEKDEGVFYSMHTNALKKYIREKTK